MQFRTSVQSLEDWAEAIFVLLLKGADIHHFSVAARRLEEGTKVPNITQTKRKRSTTPLWEFHPENHQCRHTALGLLGKA